LLDFELPFPPCAASIRNLSAAPPPHPCIVFFLSVLFSIVGGVPPCPFSYTRFSLFLLPCMYYSRLYLFSISPWVVCLSSLTVSLAPLHDYHILTFFAIFFQPTGLNFRSLSNFSPTFRLLLLRAFSLFFSQGGMKLVELSFTLFPPSYDEFLLFLVNPPLRAHEMHSSPLPLPSFRQIGPSFFPHLPSFFPVLVFTQNPITALPPMSILPFGLPFGAFLIPIPRFFVWFLFFKGVSQLPLDTQDIHFYRHLVPRS